MSGGSDGRYGDDGNASEEFCADDERYSSSL